MKKKLKKKIKYRSLGMNFNIGKLAYEPSNAYLNPRKDNGKFKTKWLNLLGLTLILIIIIYIVLRTIL